MLHIQRMISLSLDGGSSLTFQPIRVKTNLDWNVEIVRRFALTPIHSCRLTQTTNVLCKGSCVQKVPNKCSGDHLVLLHLIHDLVQADHIVLLLRGNLFFILHVIFFHLLHHLSKAEVIFSGFIRKLIILTLITTQSL